MERPWNADEYVDGPIEDSVRTVASALDKVINECLGDPLSPRVIASALVRNVWKSTSKLSAALSTRPVQVVFDEMNHRVLPMALGNLVNGTWKVAGVYDPDINQFTEHPEIFWPKTSKMTPRSWVSCALGERLAHAAGDLQRCWTCAEGSFSVGGQSTVCAECAPGELCLRRRYAQLASLHASFLSGQHAPDPLGTVKTDALVLGNPTPLVLGHTPITLALTNVNTNHLSANSVQLVERLACAAAGQPV